MHFVHSLFLFLAILAAFALADPISKPVDVKDKTKDILEDIRELTEDAKEGKSMDDLLWEVLDIQDKVIELSRKLGGDVSEAETNLIIKMAAAHTGSHEVLTVLLADDTWRVLSGRLEMSLEFLRNVASLLENELRLSGDVKGHLMALVFGTNTTASIINHAVETARATRLAYNSSDSDITIDGDDDGSRSRRQAQLPAFNLPGGFSIGVGGLSWRSPSGLSSFNIRPSFRGIRLDGFQTSLTLRF